MFAYEKWDVYKQATRILEIGVEIKSKYRRRVMWKDMNNFERAAGSIMSNIAEGAGRFQPKEKIHLYQIACGSTSETNDAAFQMQKKLGQDPLFEEARRLSNSVAAMLTNLILSIEKRIE